MNRRAFMKMVAGGAVAALGLGSVVKPAMEVESTDYYIGPDEDYWHAVRVSLSFKKTLTTGPGAFEPGPIVEIIPAGHIRADFDIKYTFAECFDCKGLFALKMYSRGELLCEMRFARGCCTNNVLMETWMAIQQKGNPVEVSLASSEVGKQLATITLDARIFPTPD